MLFLLAIGYLVFNGIADDRERKNAIIYLNQEIKKRDITIKILRDSLALDSVLIISSGVIGIGQDTVGEDSIVVSLSNANLREWTKK